MANVEEILMSFETCRTALAEQEFERSVGQLANAEIALIQGRTLFKEHMARCGELAASDHIRSRYSPTLRELAMRSPGRANPTEGELEQAGIDMAILEFYRRIFGPDAAGDLSPERDYSDWQTAIVGRFRTKQEYLEAIGPTTAAYKRLVSDRRGLDSYLNVLLMVVGAYERVTQQIYNIASLVGRYLIKSELWVEHAGDYKLRKSIELNGAQALAGPGRQAAFIWIDDAGNLAHSYRLASTIRNSGGETITSQAGDLTPVQLVPRTFAEQLPNPSTVAVIDFGRRQQYRLNVQFQSKAGSEDQSDQQHDDSPV